MKQTIIIVLAVVLVIPTASVLYALAGGGTLGTILCMLLGVVAYLSVGFLVGLVVEAYEWIKYRKDWTNEDKGGKL